jgi:putative endonuclease
MFGLIFGRKRLLADRARLGRWGERYCERYLKRKGLVCVARNFLCRTGEIDLVMADGDAIVFVEVKTRTSEEVIKAQEAVNWTKQRKIISASKFFVSQYHLRGRCVRFDVVVVVLGEVGEPEVRYYENAFS